VTSRRSKKPTLRVWRRLTKSIDAPRSRSQWFEPLFVRMDDMLGNHHGLSGSKAAVVDLAPVKAPRATNFNITRLNDPRAFNQKELFSLDFHKLQ